MARHLCQGGRFGVGVPDGGRRQPVHHGLHSFEIGCGLPVHCELGVVGEPQQPGLLGAKRNHGLHQLQDIEATPAASPADGRLVEAAPDVAVLQGRHGGLVAGLDERKQEFSVVPGRAGCFGGAGDVVRRQP
ncbi:hypothetical protein D9M72_597900 [compost metagenome]